MSSRSHPSNRARHDVEPTTSALLLKPLLEPLTTMKRKNAVGRQRAQLSCATRQSDTGFAQECASFYDRTLIISLAEVLEFRDQPPGFRDRLSKQKNRGAI
jgi:hypothetical protein